MFRLPTSLLRPLISRSSLIASPSLPIRTFATSSARMSAPYTTVSTPNAPSAVGPYSQALKTDSLVFLSGCIPLNPETMKVVEGGVEAQTEQALKNLTAVVEASGSKLSHVVKCTVFIKDMNDFPKINTIYSKHFGEYKPARSCVEVARLPLDVLVEIEAIATLPK